MELFFVSSVLLNIQALKPTCRVSHSASGQDSGSQNVILHRNYSKKVVGYYLFCVIAVCPHRARVLESN